MFDPMIHRRLRARHDRLRQLCRALNIDVPKPTDPNQWPAIVTPTAQTIVDAIGAAAEKGRDPAADATVQTLLARREIGRDHHLQAWREYQATQIDERAMSDEKERIDEALHAAFVAAVETFEDTGDALAGLDRLGGEIDWRDAAKVAEPMAQALDAERRIKACIELWWMLNSDRGMTGHNRNQLLVWTAPTGYQLRSVQLWDHLDEWAQSPWRLWNAGVELRLCEDVNAWEAHVTASHAEADAIPQHERDQWGRVGDLAAQRGREKSPAPTKRRGARIV